MRKILLDIVKHVSVVGGIEQTKITGSAEETRVEAIDKDKTVIVNGTLRDPSEQLRGEYGIGFFPLLTGLLNHKTYLSDNASIEIIRQDRGGVETPVEMLFKNDKGKNPAKFRFINKDYVNEMGVFRTPVWDYEIELDKSTINEFASLADLYSAFEKFFSVKTSATEVIFSIGDDSNALHSAQVVMASDLDKSVEFSNEINWNIAPILSAMKLGQDHNPVLKLSARGAIELSFSSALVDWRFIFPPRKR